MKRLITIVTVALICLLTVNTTQAADIFNDVKAHPDVESVHVNRFMMSIARMIIKKSADKDSNTALEFIKDIKSMDLITCENRKSIKTVQSLVKKAITDGKYELALESKDKDEIAYIWCLPDKAKDSGNLRDVIIEVVEPKEYSLIKINGKIDPTKFTSEAFK